MKTKIKRHSRSVISVILAVCMLVSCMTVGLIATDAAKVDSESVGWGTSDTWYTSNEINSWGQTACSSTGTHRYYDFYFVQSDSDFYFRFKTQSQDIQPNTDGQDVSSNGTGDNSVGSSNAFKFKPSTLTNSNQYYKVRTLFEASGNWCWTETSAITNLTPSFNVSSTTITEGSSVTLSGATSTGDAIGTVSYKYQVSTDGSSFSDLSSTTYTPSSTGTYYFRVKATDGGVNTSTNAKTARIYYSSAQTVTVNPATTTLTTPTISFANSGAVNNGDSAILTVTNHSTITAQGDTSMSYALFKNGTAMTLGSGYSYNDGVFTITNYADGDSFTVQAVTGNTSDYVSSAVSSAATLTVYEPRYALLGCADSDDIENIINADASHASTKAYGWPTASDETDDSVHFNSTVVVSGATETPGVYYITFTTKEPSWDINIGLYQKTVGQRGFSYGGTDYTSAARGSELKVPSAGLTGVEIINGTSSMQFKPNITYTITIDQTGSTDVLSITSNAADIWAVARVKTFNPTTGQLNSSVSNATAAVGTATASPSAGTTPFTSTLTATVADSTNYEFAGWYTDAACTNSYNASATTTATVSTDVTYYALFTQKTPDTVALTVETTGTGTVTATSGTHSGSGSSYTIYPGATVVFTATPGTDYELSSATSTSGTVTKNGNTVTVSNITAAATVSFTFTEVQTYDVTLQADSAAYGSLTATYVNKSGTSVTTSAITSSTTITVKQGEVVTLTATAGTSGNFDGWSVVSGTYTRSSSTPLSAATINIKPTSDLSMKANFTAKGTSTSYYLLRSTNNNPSNMSNSGLTIYSRDDGYYVTIPYSSMNGTGDVYFAISNSSSYTDMWNQNSGDSIAVSVASGSTSYIEASSQGYNVGSSSYTFAHAKLKDTSVSSVTLHMWHTNSGKTLNYEFSVGSSFTDDTTDVSGYTALYVLDGIDMDGSVGTNSFGDSVIISANSGLATYNYYDAEGSDVIISSETGYSEGGLIYYYDPDSDLDFRVQTTIASGHQALGVRAFVMNGMTYAAKKSSDGVYYADITLEAGSNQGVLEVIPVYYNTLIEANGDYIKFYVDANTIGDKFGKTIGYSIWYTDTSLHAETGGYPGQPLMSDGSLLYGYFPKYYVDNNATAVPAASSRVAFSGVLLSNLAEHNDTHKAVLTAWECNTANYQSFDYEDPYKISQLDDVDMIEFVAKYKELNTTHRYDSSYNARNLNGTTGKSWPATITRPTSAATALSNGFEYLTDIDGNRVNIFNEKGTLTGDPLYVVSVGNQQVGSNDWDTVWEVYTSSGTSIAAARPVDFINPDSTLQTALSAYTSSPVLINYEGWLAGENNSGTRLDGRWLYSKSTDDTTLRLRVATQSGGTLSFMTDGITWAEITDGTNDGVLEAADTTNYTKLLELDDRLTEVTAKINPVGYMVTGMYMLSASYSDDTDNGYSSSLSDYDDMNVTGTATSFVNAKDNRMVIVVEQIPASDLVVYHQMYGGPGAHKITGFFYSKVELYDDENGNLIDTSSSANASKYGVFSNKQIQLSSFTTDAPYSLGYYLKVTIRTVMSGSATFYQWYENDHNSGYTEIDSTSAHGSSDPVEKELWISVDDLYTVSEGQATSLGIQNLDYYSDLQAAGSVSINHLLLPAATAAGLSGTAYTQVTVVNSSGTAVSGGSYAAKVRTTEVDSDFITSDNAEDGYQLKVEIWTIPTTPAVFDAFYKDTSTEMTTEVDGGIVYTTGQTKTFNGTTYTSATVIIPISYFFKQVYDSSTDSTVLQFDTTKQNYYLYSALEMMDLAYSFTYKYASRLYGDQTYTASDDVSLALYNSYFVYENETLKFQSAAKMQEFLAAKAPYEDNYKQTLTFDFSGYTDTSVTTFSENTISLAAPITATATDARTINVQFEFPYEYTNTTGTYDTAVTPNTTTNADYKSGAVFVAEAEETLTYQPLLEGQTQRGKMQYLDWVSLNTKHNSTTEATDEEPAFITAPDVIVEVSSGSFMEKTFQYWSMKDTANNEYKKCYSKEFNMAVYQNSIIEPVYSATSLVDGRDENASATLNFLEYSRNQWNNGGGNAPGLAAAGANNYWLNFGDRVFTDFVLSFELNNQKLQTQNVADRAGLLIETVGDLDTVEDELQTDNSYYQTQYDALSSEAKSTIEENAKTAVANKRNSAAVDSKYLFSFINFNKLDNKNSIEYYYAFANVSMTSANENNNNIVATTRRDKVYRAFSFIVDESGNVTVSTPVYFTIYDVATVADGETL